ncbi:flagellar export chaperone FliS [Alicyclobacillus fodiniaquatilis]|uniref:Flagellar export chaperone FliS n=1 Tax=Alicyclobacillus fodiniaquatilis TaxID=1661150 RepID=A0ABW4JP50_9BACL
MRNPYQAYKQNSVTTASPKALLIRLHDKSIDELRAAKQNFKDGNVDEMRPRIQKTQDIVAYLRGCTDTQTEVGERLVRLYNYYYQKLFESFVSPSNEVFDELLGYFESWKETWIKAE